jgi:integrase
MGYIVRRNGRWQAAYRGPDRRERTRTFDRKVDAERWLATTEADLLRGEWVDPRSGQVLFEECANRWLASKVDLAPSSLDKVQRHVRRHILPVFGQRPVGHIQPADVRAWVAKMSAAGLAPDSVKAIYLTFGQIMSTAEIDRLVVRSPCVGIKLPKSTAREEQHFLSAEQVTLLAETITPRFRALIYTAAYAGLRAGEIGALRVDRLNLLAGTLEVAASVWEGKGQMVIGPPKSGKRRTLTIPRFLAEMLGEHIGTPKGRCCGTGTSTTGTSNRPSKPPGFPTSCGSTTCATPAPPSWWPTAATWKRSRTTLATPPSGSPPTATATCSPEPSRSSPPGSTPSSPRPAPPLHRRRAGTSWPRWPNRRRGIPGAADPARARSGPTALITPCGPATVRPGS